MENVGRHFIFPAVQFTAPPPPVRPSRHPLRGRRTRIYGYGGIQPPERPAPKLVVLAIVVREFGFIRDGEETETEEELELVSGHGAAGEGEVLVDDEVKECGVVEEQQRAAPRRLPQPVEVAGARGAAVLHHAILAPFDGLANGPSHVRPRPQTGSGRVAVASCRPGCGPHRTSPTKCLLHIYINLRI